jgi:integrase
LARAAKADEGPAGLAVLIGLYSGLRREEIAKLRWAEIREGWLEFVGKLDISRQVPIHPELATRLELAHAEQLGAGIDSPYVFPGRVSGHASPTTIWTWSRRLGREALAYPVATHVLRHTAIATLNDVTHDLRAAQAFAGHASPETTVLYTRVSRDRLIDAVAAISYEEKAT